MLKTIQCGELRPEHSGQEVTLAGWVNRRRDQGGLIFIDLRDRWGICQVVVDQETAPDAHNHASNARNEYVIQVVGKVRMRPDGTSNPELATGDVEVVASEIEILNAAKTPPFYINKEDSIDEVVRMKYRYLDLRRPKMQRNIVLRHRVIKFIRDWLDAQGFVEVETPILFKTTPEGARDFLVPSRLQPGKFYALPQSPQQLKQLLMVAGYERYFQIARCFRDEDLRGQRQPEFTQLDMEISFVEREDVIQLNETLMRALVKAVVPEKRIMEEPFPRILYQDAMEWYGSDKPDIRYDLRAVDVADLAGQSGFAVFVNNVAEGKPVKAMRVPGMAGNLSGTRLRTVAAELEDMAKAAGAKGLAYMALPLEEDGEVRGPVGKFFTVDQKLALFERLGAQPGDLILFMSDRREVVWAVTDALRPHLAKELGLLDPTLLGYCWIVDFPEFLWNEDEQRWDPSQHLFTMPMPEDIPLLDTDPGAARGSQYDMVCNGFEVAGGSIRIHDRALQEKIFPLIGQDMDSAREQFGHILEAFEYGVPPHGGIAWGIDRVVAILAGEPNIREVIAFPKSQTGSDVMSGTPSSALPAQLEELHIKLDLPEEEEIEA
ncbi:MAG: aspartate--tRNA ligase [Anaerolineae bacterium]|nr:aspartate--tRNA ligase [Anaerolineae bacterium]